MSEVDENEEKDIKQENDIEIVSGDGSELDVSPVYEHLNIAKPTPKDEDNKKKIIIPEVKEKKED